MNRTKKLIKNVDDADVQPERQAVEYILDDLGDIIFAREEHLLRIETDRNFELRIGQIGSYSTRVLDFLDENEWTKMNLSSNKL